MPTKAHSIVGVTFDLLEFDGHGNFSKFDRCFSKACSFFSLDLAPHDRRMLRNTAFRYLRTIGYLDVMQEGSETFWSTCPATFVQRAPADFVLIGGTSVSEMTRDLSSEHVDTIRSSDESLPQVEGLFFPNVIRVNADPGHIEALAQLTNARVSIAYQDRIFRSLPSIHTVLRDSTVHEDAPPVFEHQCGARFKFSVGEWQPIEGLTAMESGLYRRSFDHAPPEYFVVSSSIDGTHSTFRITHHEWALVVGAQILGRTLPVKYDRKRKQVSMSRNCNKALRLPTLIERALRSGSLLNPKFSKDWVAYDNVDLDSVRRLRQQFPVFTNEEAP